MKNLKIKLALISLVILTHSCTSDKKFSQDDEFGTDSTEVAAETSSPDTTTTNGVDPELSLDDGNAPAADVAKSETPPAASGEKDEFAEFGDKENVTPPPANVADTSNEDALEKELNSLEEKPAAVAQAEPSTNIPMEQAPAAPTDTVVTPPPEIAATPPPVVDIPPQIEEPAAPIAQVPQITPQASGSETLPPVPMAPPPVGQINSVQYQSNQSGGTVVINGDQPLQFTTRLNSATHQLVIEVQNTVIPKKLKRSLNTKDMASSIGSVDIYQKPNSKISRFVVQLRPGAPEPLVQPEGTSLLIVGAANPSYVRKNENMATNEKSENQGIFHSSPEELSSGGTPAVAHQSMEVNPDLTSEGIMNTQSLEDFLANNNKFYGKKISIEAVKLDINDAFKFLSEESGVNMIIDDGVKGEVTLKLRQVPWDQAFILILKSKKLGYRRQGNVIRIAEIGNLQKEEDDAVHLMEARKNVQPLIVKRFFIGYAEIGELEKKIKDFISTTVLTATGSIATTPSRGKVLSDARTNSLIVTETAENLQKIEKLVSALDTQPKQVLIEGKVVEASEKFSRSVGVKWGTDGTNGPPAGNFIRPSVLFDPGISGVFSPSVGIGIPGSPGDFGNLNATLALGEKEDKIRVLSSPRISVLSSQSATIAQTVNVQVDKAVTGTPGTSIVTTTKETVAVGVTLSVTPQVSNEGTVVMDLSIERSFLSGASGSDIEKRNAKTKVIVRSGQTAVIGGIFQADASDTVVGIPFLKDIPIFGHLFKNSSKNRSKNELVIFVTPRIQQTVKGDVPTVTQFQ